MDIPEVIREKATDFEEQDLQEYLERVKKLLNGMIPGQQMEIEKITMVNTRDLFIECVKYYIRESPLEVGIQFNKDFSMIMKYDVF